MIRDLTVSAISVPSKPGQSPDNLALIAGACRKAAGLGAKIVVFPELSVTGFIPNHPVGDHAEWLRGALKTAWGTAERLDGQAVDALVGIAREAGVYVGAGLMENAGNVLLNTFVLVGDGRLVGYWRKMHIPMFEMPIYNGGGVPEVVETPFGRVGANICFDALLPESTRLLGVQNCEIGLVPFAADPAPGTAEAWANWARPVLQARCAENGMFGVACNYKGLVECAGAEQAFPGGALVIGPSGEVLSEAADMLVVRLEQERLLEARAAFEYTFRFRRPELYELLARK
ncbi:MAG: carbon-nitrogen hydrolase family protein [Bryobacterales bacterium]|nr:carbon-nitrogen hydrolase family protein [Bryobacterales bacterium]